LSSNKLGVIVFRLSGLLDNHLLLGKVKS